MKSNPDEADQILQGTDQAAARRVQGHDRRRRAWSSTSARRPSPPRARALGGRQGRDGRGILEGPAEGPVASSTCRELRRRPVAGARRWRRGGRARPAGFAGREEDDRPPGAFAVAVAPRLDGRCRPSWRPSWARIGKSLADIATPARTSSRSPSRGWPPRWSSPSRSAWRWPSPCSRRDAVERYLHAAGQAAHGRAGRVLDPVLGALVQVGASSASPSCWSSFARRCSSSTCSTA